MDFIISKLISLLVSLFFLFHALAFRKTIGTFIFPASLFSLAWFLFTFIPNILLFDTQINPLPLMFIFLCVFSFSLGALPFNWTHAFRTNATHSGYFKAFFNNNFIFSLILTTSILSLLFSTLNMTNAGFTLKSIFLNLVTTSGQYAKLRGQGYLDYGLWAILSIFFTYTSSAIAGLALSRSISLLRNILLILFSLIPALYFMLTQSAKLILFYSFGFFISSLLYKKLKINDYEIFNWGLFLILGFLLIILLPLISISFISRETFLLFRNTTTGIWFSIKSYLLAQPFAFADYFSYLLGYKSESIYIHDLRSYGQYSFTSLHTLFGTPKYFPPGTYYDGYFHNDEFATNIFTLFRGLINDFGIVGSILFMYLTGLIAHLAYYFLLINKKTYISSSIFICLVLYFEGSYLLSVFMARFMYLIFVSMAIIFWANHRFNNRKIIN